MDKETVNRLLELGVSPAAINFAKGLIRARHKEMGLTYQAVLCALLFSLPKEKAPGAVVETGCGSGVSTYFVNHALAAYPSGHLFSCDPLFTARGYALEKFRVAEVAGVRPTTEGVLADPGRWTFVGGGSPQALTTIKEAAAEAGFAKWTAFIHDSAPGLLEKELAFALPLMREDALIVVPGSAETHEEVSISLSDAGWTWDQTFGEEGEGYKIWCINKAKG